MKSVIIAMLLVIPALAQSTLSGTATLSGVNSIGGSSQYTFVWAYAPPNGAPDNAKFVNAVMSRPVVDGVSLLESWSSIETSAPGPTCGNTAPDYCQPDPMIPNTYHSYDWTTYDSTAVGNPVMQWFGAFSGVHKKVNLLISGESAGTTNPSTPSYVTGSAWTSLFSGTYARQDVVNYALDGCSPWTGTPTGVTSGITMTRDATTGKVTVSWNSQPYSATDALYGYGFSPLDYAPVAGTAVQTPMTNSFIYQSQCTAGSCSNPLGPTTYGSLISAAQSYAVPYEYPYKSALKAFWAAVVAHYGPALFSKFSQLNYFRFGGSVGSEWYPYCVANLESIAAPYTYVKQSGLAGSTVGWLDYYQEMTAYLQSLSPPFKVINSINAAELPVDYTYGTSEAEYAVTYSNGYGAFNGFGSQGLSAADAVICPPNGTCNAPPPYSASNWYQMFQRYKGTGVPLELQQAAISYPGDTTCSIMCGFGSGYYAGDLPTFLNLAVLDGLTDIEIYWRDLDLAFDSSSYCTVSGSSGSCGAGTASCGGGITLGGQITADNQFCFFQAVGQSTSGSYCGISGVGQPPYQSGATGTCSYANAIVNAHGAH